jgi:hypothetical protein
MNLVQAGESILIFEGFDELRHAGRAYDRHEHFNSLWAMAYPGTKVIFTGRPYFFLDEVEKNRTLRTTDTGAFAYTQLWELVELNRDEVERVACGFGKELGRKIMEAAKANPAFFDIVSRPSMLPVVATIWERIENYQRQGSDLTSAILIENYIRAIYERKEYEIHTHQQKDLAAAGASYLNLPREIRELFTMTIVWKMAGQEARNTIRRGVSDDVIREIYNEVIHIGQIDGVETITIYSGFIYFCGAMFWLLGVNSRSSRFMLLKNLLAYRCISLGNNSDNTKSNIGRDTSDFNGIVLKECVRVLRGGSRSLKDGRLGSSNGKVRTQEELHNLIAPIA